MQYPTPYQQPPYRPSASVSIGGGMNQKSIDIQRAMVGRIIGKGGKTITQIKQKSDCKVQIELNIPDGMLCEINLIGTPQSIRTAEQLMTEPMIAESPG